MGRTDTHVLLASLLKQLIQERSSVPGSVKALYVYHSKRRTRPTIDEISKVLHSVARTYSRLFILVDALTVAKLSSYLRFSSSNARCGAKIFATSRIIVEIMWNAEWNLPIGIRASDDDVRSYLDNYVYDTFITLSPELQEEIGAGITKAVDGM